MFSWKTRISQDPIYYRAVYIMQAIAVLAVIAGLFLPWWSGDEPANAFDLMRRSLDKVLDRNPAIIIEPLGVLWLLWPALIICGMRAFTGVQVQPVTYHRLALVAWLAAMLALAHFYINFGDKDLSIHSPLQAGAIDDGFWLTGSSTAILGLLMLAEWLLDQGEPDAFTTAPGRAGPVDDAERLWRGEYLTCPYCGMLNEPGSKKCYNCGNLLFDFEDE